MLNDSILYPNDGQPTDDPGLSGLGDDEEEEKKKEEEEDPKDEILEDEEEIE